MVKRNTRGEIGWLVDTFSHPDDIVRLPKLNCELPVFDVYEDIAFDEDM